MKNVLIFIVSLSLFITSCKKDSNNPNQPIKLLKKMRSTGSRSESAELYFYDSDNRLIRMVSTYTGDTSSAYRDTNQIIGITYQNNLPYRISDTLGLYNIGSISTYQRMLTYNSQNQILKDSLISFNLNTPYSGPFAYKDTIYNLTNRNYTYNGSTQTVRTYNSPLLNKPYLWVVENNTYSNENLTLKTSVLYKDGNSIYDTSSVTYSNVLSPLYKFLIPYFGQSKNLPSQEDGYNYQYFLDSDGYVIKSIQTRSGSTTFLRTYIYEYY